MASTESRLRISVNSIVTVALVVAGLDLLTAAVINIPAAGASPFLLIVVLFVALFFLFAYASWRGRRWAYIGGVYWGIFVKPFFRRPPATPDKSPNSSVAASLPLISAN